MNISANVLAKYSVTGLALLAGFGLFPPSVRGNADEGRVDLSKVPGVVVSHVQASTGFYVGSPSIVILPNGDYVVSHDSRQYRSPQHPQPDETSSLTRIFTSKDRGLTWTHLTDVKAFWSSLFVHRGALYLIGPNKVYGDVMIIRSLDGGRTWTEPTAGSGLLIADGGRYHTAPTPVVEHNGRIWRAMEEHSKGHSYSAFMMSAPVDADLLDPKSWTSSNRVRSDKAWLDGQFADWLEGNAVVTPDGGMVDRLRVGYPKGAYEQTATVKISADGKTATFDPATGFSDFPGGGKKFSIRFDPQTKSYWTLASYVPQKHRGDGTPGSIRNTLALVSSPDLVKWTVKTIVLYHPEIIYHGFQYADWQFDGADLVVVSRTGFDDGVGGANSVHNANLITFHRVKNFRQLTPKDSVPGSPPIIEN
jgi:hypothetical protein